MLDVRRSDSCLIAIFVSSGTLNFQMRLGVTLIFCSAQSKFPIALQVISWLSLVAAIILALIGRQRFKALITWAVNIAPFYHHIGGFIAMDAPIGVPITVALCFY